MRRYMMLCVIVQLFYFPAAIAEEKPVAVKDLKDNVQARLVAAQISESRAQYLVAEFQTVEKEPTSIFIGFTAHRKTPHERTLMAVIKSCVDTTGEGLHQRRLAESTAIFSIPKGDNLREQELIENCYLVSLKLGKAK